MFPYFEQPAWTLGPVTIHAFGVAVAAAIWVGLSMAQRRFERLGLDPGLGYRLGGWMLAGGLLGAHLFSVLLYVPHKLRADPWLLLRLWEDISSFGGMVGAFLGAALFFTLRVPGNARRQMLAYLDAIAFVFPASLAIGRLGCAVAHDHPGMVTTFPLAISLESEPARHYIDRVYHDSGMALPADLSAAGFHDLGLYEFLYLALVVVPAFVYWSRSRRPAGFYVIAFSALYFPVRFAFDTLRAADPRYLGLTPAQWGAAVIMAALPFAAIRQCALRYALCGVVILVTACACWGGS